MQHVGCTTALRFALRSACRLGNTTLLWRALHVFVHTQSISTCASTVRNICASCVLPLEITDLFPLLVAVALMHNGMALPPSRHPNISESPSSTRLQLPGSYSLLSPCTGTQQGQEEGGGREVQGEGVISRDYLTWQDMGPYLACHLHQTLH